MLRDLKKEGRRRSIIHAAETLIREKSSIDFSMQELAKTAGLSPATTYNLIGSKGVVLYILLNQFMDRIDLSASQSSTVGNPLQRVIQAADDAVMVYTADPNFFRPLLRFLLGIPDPTHRPAFMQRAYRYWTSVISSLTEAGLLGDELQVSDLARDLQIFFAGAISLWVHEELDATTFKEQVRHGVILRLLALDIKSERGRLLKELDRARRVLGDVGLVDKV